MRDPSDPPIVDPGAAGAPNSGTGGSDPNPPAIQTDSVPVDHAFYPDTADQAYRRNFDRNFPGHSPRHSAGQESDKSAPAEGLPVPSPRSFGGRPLSLLAAALASSGQGLPGEVEMRFSPEIAREHVSPAAIGLFESPRERRRQVRIGSKAQRAKSKAKGQRRKEKAGRRAARKGRR